MSWQVEVRGSQVRVTLYYRSITDAAITGWSAALEDPSGFLRYELAPTATVIPPRSTLQQVLLAEAISAVHPGASLAIEYTTTVGGVISKRVASFELPLTVASFDEPLALAAQDLLVRWNALTVAGLEVAEIFAAPHVTPAVAHKTLTTVREVK